MGELVKAAWVLPLGLACVLIGLAGLPPAWQAALALDRAGLAAGQGWRLWTGHWVHFGWPHAVLNALALALTAACVVPGQGYRVVLGAAVCAPLLSLAILVAEPGLLHYRGASGLVVWLGTWVWCQAWQQRRVQRRWLLVLALALLGKLVWEAWPGHMVRSDSLPGGVRLAWSAHGAGAVLGGLWAVLPWGFRKARGLRRPVSHRDRDAAG
jgi:rhomboid family GlyGly-CTERM serine protease